MSQRAAATRLGIKQPYLNKILKQREDILEQRQSGDPMKARRRQRTGASPDVEAALIAWIAEVRNKGAPLSVPLIMQKAQRFSELLGVNNFKPGGGWLCRFQRRHRLHHHKIHGEAAEADLLSKEA